MSNLIINYLWLHKQWHYFVAIIRTKDNLKIMLDIFRNLIQHLKQLLAKLHKCSLECFISSLTRKLEIYWYEDIIDIYDKDKKK